MNARRGEPESWVDSWPFLVSLWIVVIALLFARAWGLV
jgi:hypothetical protein